MKLRDLITNDNGTLSRTQISIWIAFMMTIGLTLADVLCDRSILTWPVLAVLGGLHVFALLDRANARKFAFRVGRDGVGLEIGQGDGGHDEFRDDEPHRRGYRP